MRVLLKFETVCFLYFFIWKAAGDRGLIIYSIDSVSLK